MIPMRDNKEGWARRAVVYQIYPRSFKDGSGDGTGDLSGIIEKLDYLNDGTPNSLGVEAIWLSPVYRSPMKDGGYDVTDHCDIDPLFGDLATFDRLVDEARKRGMRIIMDFVPNHTSEVHPWFRESRSSRDNAKRNWYVWADPRPTGESAGLGPIRDGSPPNNWLSVFGGPAWTFDKNTGQYYLHHFLPEQPDLNWRNPQVKQAMFDVLRFWIKRRVSGFRTDSLYHLIEDRELRDDPLNPAYRPGHDDPYNAHLHEFTQGRDELFPILEEFSYVLLEEGDKFMVTEAYLDIKEMERIYKASFRGRLAPLNFNLMTIPWGATQFREFIDRFEATLGENDWPNYVLGNHDVSRVVSRVGSEQARLLAILQLTLRGMPFVYYGEEIGMRDSVVSKEAACDPAAVNRDPQRSPMQWDGTDNGGFCPSDVKPWLPLSPDWEHKHVAGESKDPHSILSLYRNLIWHRKSSSALLSGRYRPCDAHNGYVYAYERVAKDELLTIVLNFDDHPQQIKLSVTEGTVVTSTHLNKPGQVLNLSSYTLHPYEGLVLSSKVA